MNFSANDDHIDALLRRSVSALPDDGFSTRVLAALPTTATDLPARRIRQRRICYIAGSVAGVAYVLYDLGWDHAALSWDQWAAMTIKIGSSLFDPMVIVGLTIAALSLAVVFQAELRERLLP